ncbi:MAG: N-acetyl sugar amidotransferase [Bacteroidia bacterium]|nr:N-acetyl sugar amidotransferase [Bacteroidia bacterium]MCC7532428.1 N-acetyl sugar amidotransferase [Bacteroidia bacterium]
MKLKKDGPYQICTHCVMDTSDPDIEFNKDGVCNHCLKFEELIKQHIPGSEESLKKLSKLIERIKKDGKGKEYDCIIGLSGGVDSSYVALLVNKFGLRPLAVHLDNGWNSELAVENIENIIKKLNIDLYTIVIDWEEFRDLQLAYLYASVIDIEAISDHAIIATMHKLAKKNKIKYIISGTNIATESILPESWYYKHKTDYRNIKDIYKKHGSGRKLKTYPRITWFKMLYYNYFLNLTTISILNYIDYKKENVIKLISEELGWKSYGDKHHESIITKFYQAYILPKKTGFDKRRAHLSNLICSKQISREIALNELTIPVYKSDLDLNNDINYFKKKLEISNNEFDKIINTQPKSHYEYKTNRVFRLWNQRFKQLIIILKRNFYK